MDTRQRLTGGRLALLVGAVLYVGFACAIQPRDDVEPHQWWEARGPVVPHGSFPDDCSLCHIGEHWDVSTTGLDTLHFLANMDGKPNTRQFWTSNR